MCIDIDENKNLCEYLSLYRRLIQKRGELDARIDFTEELIKNTTVLDVADFDLIYYDKNGRIVRKVSTKDE